MPDPKVTTVTREHRAEAARLLGFEPALGGWHLNVMAHRWVEGEPVPEWWLAEREQGALLPLVAQALADRDARIGELEKHSDTMAGLYAGAVRQLAVENDSHDATKTQLARVVGVLREYEGVVGDLKHAAEVGQEDRSLALFLLDKAIVKLETLK